MTDANLISLRFFLSLAEAQEGLKIATQSSKSHSKLWVPLICVLIIVWGVWLGTTQGGLYFIILGGAFLLLQFAFQFVLLPWLFKRQYHKQQIFDVEQGVEIEAQTITLFYDNDHERFPLSELTSVKKGKHIYLLAFDSGLITVVPTRAVQESGQTAWFEQRL